MKVAVAYLSLAAQLLFYVSVIAMLFEIFGLTEVAADQPESNVAEVQNQLTAIFKKHQKFFGIGVLGAIAHLVVLKNRVVRDDWFLKVSRIFGWIWLPMVPIGTVLGILLLGARRAELDLRNAEL